MLNSEELAELLYIAYNRDDADLLNFRKALEMEYDALYTTSEDVIKKKEAAIEEKLEKEALDIATQAVLATDMKDKIKKAKGKEKDKVLEIALSALAQYESQFDPILYQNTVMELLKLTSIKYENDDVEEKSTTTPKTTKETTKKDTATKKRSTTKKASKV